MVDMTRQTRKARRGDLAKAVGIVRVSTSKQDIGAEAQRHELKRWAKEQGVDLLAIFEDIGVSGSAPMAKRRGLIAGIVAAREFGAGILLACNQDRFARSRLPRAEIEVEAARAGAVLVTTDGRLTGEDSETEDVNASLGQLLASLELRRIRDRNQRRARQCLADGRTHGGKIAYGYRRKRGGKRGRSGVIVELERDPDEQRTVRRIVALAESGLSLRGVSQALAEEGLHTREGRVWQAMAVKRILDRENAGSAE